MYQPDCLTKREVIELHQFTLDLICVTHGDDLRAALLRLHDFFMFDSVICAYGDPGTIDRSEPLNSRIFQVDFPEAFLCRYLQQQYYRIDPIVSELLSTWAPQNWGMVRKHYRDENLARIGREAKAHGLLDGWSHGVCHPLQKTGSVFSFAGAAMENDLRTQTILQMVVPHLGQVLQRLFHGPIERQRNIEHLGLTQRELEVLKWLRQGKSSWEISVIIQRSERVVNFHVKNLVFKLGAVNRLQAMAIAMEMGLV
jgi:DNA-binding CsgD family transcriptional regulator